MVFTLMVVFMPAYLDTDVEVLCVLDQYVALLHVQQLGVVLYDSCEAKASTVEMPKALALYGMMSCASDL